MPHDHNHDHGEGCAHESTDSDYLKEIGIQYSLFKKIDVDNLECLNETVDGSAKLIFKPYEERLNFDKVTFFWHSHSITKKCFLTRTDENFHFSVCRK